MEGKEKATSSQKSCRSGGNTSSAEERKQKCLIEKERAISFTQTKDPKCICSDLTHYNDSNIELPVPVNLQDQRWLFQYVCAFQLGSSGFSYFGDVSDGRMHGFGRLLLGDGQYVEGTWMMNRMEELLSCKLICGPGKQTVLISKREDDYLLTMCENHSIARVNIQAIKELDFADSVENVKRLLFRKLTVLELVVDGSTQMRDGILKRFVTLLSEAIGPDVGPIARANILCRLKLYMEKSDADLADIIRDEGFPVGMRAAADDLLNYENNNLKNTCEFLKHAKSPLDLKNIVGKAYRHAIALHRQKLLHSCPKAFYQIGMLSFIQSSRDEEIFYVTTDDMDVFGHLASLPCFDHFSAFFVDLVERYSTRVRKMARSCNDPSTVIPIMSPVYGFLFKSFWETVMEIAEIMDVHSNATERKGDKVQIYRDLLKKSESGEWKLQECIKWPVNEVTDSEKRKLKVFSSSKNELRLFHKALEVQYNVIFKMLTNFSPENYIGKKIFECDFRVLEGLSWWKKTKKGIWEKVGIAKRLQTVSKERLIWLYLLDQSLYEVFNDNPKPQALLEPYKSLLEGQISLIENSCINSHEAFRTMMHNILKFIISSVPFFKVAQEQGGFDMEILAQQMWSISSASQEMNSDPSSLTNFQDLVAEFNTYLNLRLSVNIEAVSGHFSAQVSQIMETFMRIVTTSLKKSVPTSTLVWFMRALNDFLDDLKNIDFLGMYFVKHNFTAPSAVEKVENKLSGRNCSYRVVDVEMFVQVLGNQPIPRHHIIGVVTKLLDCVCWCLDKQWKTLGGKLDVVQLESTGLLLGAIRKSFMYLKEQPDYIDFQMFEKESTDPFVCLVHDCGTLDELKTRIARVSESYWYIRKMDEIGITQALEMFRNVNSSGVFNAEVLLNCYNLYLSRYDEYIATYRFVFSQGRSQAEGLNIIRQTVGEVRPLHFSMWTEQFKRQGIPLLLAGFSAVWSVLVSKDVSSTGKFLKPHCIQILCILRLLSVDQFHSMDNHLAQVLTGQGKSVILALLSSILALTGHNIRVLCYSDYLSFRDQCEFYEFFCIFGINGKIIYETFDDMADSFVNPSINGEELSLRQLVRERVMNRKSWPAKNQVTTISKNSILLIDEVDVFFNDCFYGNCYYPSTYLNFLALTSIQTYIWNLVQTENSPGKIISACYRYIDRQVADGNENMLEFKAFINKPGSYPLLKLDEDRDCYYVKQYTNKSLINEHLWLMVDDAVDVRDHDWARSDVKLDTDGIIKRKDDVSGVYSEEYFEGYQNVFNYFRLKVSNYDHMDFRNYGYLFLTIGSISYSRLPSQFQLILGVSGTLSSLGCYEKSGLEFYGIEHFSILPSFFGGSNLRFDRNVDFHFFLDECSWLTTIYEKANAVVASHRAVLIFFESDQSVDMFLKLHKTKFSRLNVLTENTPDTDRDTYINESGLSGAVTLATRGMGRGVDYKSSLLVEKNGGVHVIQTFFSIDVKEEIQIKGRTARKDNNGSYELVVCKEHLIKNEVIREDDSRLFSYQSLIRIRKKLSGDKGKTVNEKIQLTKRAHEATMKYFGLV